MASDPINILAQLALWRLEVDIIAKVFGAVFIALGVSAAAIWGPQGAEVVIWVVLGLAALAVVGAIVRALTAPFRKDPTAEARHQAAVWASSRK
jgi:hypothetical protein